MLHHSRVSCILILRELLLHARFQVVCILRKWDNFHLLSLGIEQAKTKCMMHMLLHHFRGEVRVGKIESDRLRFVPSSPQFFVKALLLTDCSLLAKERPKKDLGGA